jgi:kynurenine 3-monooxygenase
MPAQRHTIIIGAGLAGSLMACYLAKAGHRVTVYERRPDPRAKGYQGGRSINLALSARGLSGLAGAGLDQLVMRQDAVPMRGRMIHPPTLGAPLAFQPYSSNPADAINSVSRGGLNLTLINAAAASPNVSLVFDHPCIDVDLDAPAAILDAPGGNALRAEADLILGADGAFSPVRGRLQKTDRFEYSQTYLQHGYKELHIPPAATLGLDPKSHDGFAMDPNALHIWPRGGAMMIALPNRDKSFTCTLFWPLKGEHGLESLTTAREVEAFFRAHYPDAVPLMPTLADDFLKNPNGSLVTIRCWPWQYGGKVCLLGDAAHAIVPFYGQGMNAAFEDCRDLAAAFARHPHDQSAALEEFQTSRKPNADAIADMAVENFVEMRDKVADPEFRYHKKVEQAIHALFPERITPQYNLVSFSTVPYTEARRRGREVEALVQQIIARVPLASLESLGESRWTEAIRASAPVASITPLTSNTSSSLILDITPRITPDLKVWPGDTPPTREVLCEIARGDSITLSTLRATVHLGAHADGPNHYSRDGRDIAGQPLAHYLGPCHVVDAPVARSHRVRPADLAVDLAALRHARILIRTGTFPDPTRFNEDFAGLSVELIDALAARGVITIGIDTPSVDLFPSKALEAHNAIHRHDIAILEGLNLRDIPPGEYELIALPLPLAGFDASPVRAVLRPIP